MEIANLLAQAAIDAECTPLQAEAIAKKMMQGGVEALGPGGQWFLPGLGFIFSGYRPPRNYRNPKTGETGTSPGRTVIWLCRSASAIKRERYG